VSYYSVVCYDEVIHYPYQTTYQSLFYELGFLVLQSADAPRVRAGEVVLVGEEGVVVCQVCCPYLDIRLKVSHL